MTFDIIKILKLTEKDLNEVYEFLTKYFYKDEPLYGRVPPGKDEDTWLLKALSQDYSLKVLDADDNIVGVCINIDRAKLPDQLKLDNEQDGKLKKVDKLMDHIFSTIFDVQGLLHMHILAVEPFWGKRCLTGFLCNQIDTIALHNGFKGISTLSTSIYSAKIIESKGYKCRCKLHYDKYLDGNDTPIFNKDAAHTSVGIYIKLVDSTEV